MEAEIRWTTFCRWFSNAFSSMKIVLFWFTFHGNMYPRIQSMTIQHWFRWWLGIKKVTSHHLASQGPNVFEYVNQSKSCVIILDGSQLLLCSIPGSSYIISCAYIDHICPSDHPSLCLSILKYTCLCNISWNLFLKSFQTWQGYCAG